MNRLLPVLLLVGAVLGLPAAAPAYFGFIGQFGGEQYGGSRITVDGAGNIYVLSFDRVKKFSPDGQLLTSWGNPDQFDESSEPGRFDDASDIAADPAGNVYVADPGNDRLQKFSSTGEVIDANFGGITAGGVATDARGNVYVTGGDITKLTPSGAIVYRELGAGGAGEVSIAVDAAGRAYTVSSGLRQVVQYSPTGEFMRYFPKSRLPGSEPGKFSEFGITGVTVTGDDVWVGDYANGPNRINKFDTGGRFITMCASRPGIDLHPADLATAPNGDILVQQFGILRFGEADPPTPPCDVIGVKVLRLRACLRSGGRRLGRVEFKLTRPATLRFTFRNGGRRIGAFRIDAQTGRHSVRVPRPLRALRLEPGRYALRAFAVDDGGHRPAPSVAHFRVRG